MPIVKSYLNGSSAGIAPANNSHVRAKRDVVKGWSAGAVRRHTAWLYSVMATDLDGVGFALTLTMKNCPPTADEFVKLRNAYLRRLERFGASRVHWIVEWQRRGVPHLHLAVYFPDSQFATASTGRDFSAGHELADLAAAVVGPSSESSAADMSPGSTTSRYAAARTLRPAMAENASALAFPPSDLPTVEVASRSAENALGESLIEAWMDVAAPFGASRLSQHRNFIDGPLGWLQYLSKHAARGAAHYQRQGHPEGWERTGRLWGHTGDWSVRAPMRFSITNEAFWRYRRLVRAWRIADARSESDPVTRRRRVAFAKRMLRCSDPRLSPVRGVSEWIPEEVNIAFMGLLAGDGFDIIEAPEPTI